MKDRLLTLLVATVAAVGVGRLPAAPTLVYDGSNTHITGITELEVQGVVYDMTFVTGPFNDLWPVAPDPVPAPTFWGSTTGARAAVNAINALLNGARTIDASGDPIPGSASIIGSQQNYLVPFDSTGGGMYVSYHYGHYKDFNEWRAYGPSSGGDPTQILLLYAQFTPSNVIPAPGGLLLGSLGAGLVGWLGRRRSI